MIREDQVLVFVGLSESAGPPRRRFYLSRGRPRASRRESIIAYARAVVSEPRRRRAPPGDDALRSTKGRGQVRLFYFLTDDLAFLFLRLEPISSTKWTHLKE